MTGGGGCFRLCDLEGKEYRTHKLRGLLSQRRARATHADSFTYSALTEIYTREQPHVLGLIETRTVFWIPSSIGYEVGRKGSQGLARAGVGGGGRIPGEASGPLQLGAQIPRRADCLLIPEVAFAPLDSPSAGNCSISALHNQPFLWTSLETI